MEIRIHPDDTTGMLDVCLPLVLAWDGKVGFQPTHISSPHDLEKWKLSVLYQQLDLACFHMERLQLPVYLGEQDQVLVSEHLKKTEELKDILLTGYLQEQPPSLRRGLEGPILPHWQPDPPQPPAESLPVRKRIRKTVKKPQPSAAAGTPTGTSGTSQTATPSGSGTQPGTSGTKAVASGTQPGTSGTQQTGEPTDQDFLGEEEGELLEEEEEESGRQRKNFCQDCTPTISFPRLADLKDHRVVVHGAPRHKCPQCPATYKYMKGIYRHIRQVHSGEDRYMCEGEEGKPCSFHCESREKWLRHQRSQHGAGHSYKCKHCKKICPVLTSLLKHQSTGACPKLRVLKCKLCNPHKDYHMESSLKTHVKQGHGVSEDNKKEFTDAMQTTYTCYICLVKLPSAMDHFKHIRAHVEAKEVCAQEVIKAQRRKATIKTPKMDMPRKGSSKVVVVLSSGPNTEEDESGSERRKKEPATKKTSKLRPVHISSGDDDESGGSGTPRRESGTRTPPGTPPTPTYGDGAGTDDDATSGTSPRRRRRSTSGTPRRESGTRTPPSTPPTPTYATYGDDAGTEGSESGTAAGIPVAPDGSESGTPAHASGTDSDDDEGGTKTFHTVPSSRTKNLQKLPESLAAEVLRKALENDEKKKKEREKRRKEREEAQDPDWQAEGEGDAQPSTSQGATATTSQGGQGSSQWALRRRELVPETFEAAEQERQELKKTQAQDRERRMEERKRKLDPVWGEMDTLAEQRKGEAGHPTVHPEHSRPPMGPQTSPAKAPSPSSSPKRKKPKKGDKKGKKK